MAVAALLAGCEGRPSFPQSARDAAVLGKGLRPGFLLGTATAAHQIEGNNSNSWTDWELQPFPDGRPHISDGSVSGPADDSWSRFDTDLALMKKLGANAYRFSVEWSRLEPNEGEWREDVAARYLDWATRLRAAGITPMVTLFHFTLPRWVVAKGGWESDSTIDDFEAFAGRVAASLGGQVDLWCTLNEPNVYVTQGYIKGINPPGKQDQKLAATALARLMKAHARAARQIRQQDTVDADGDGKPALIGIAQHLHLFQAASNSILDATVTGLTDDFFNESFIAAATTGHIHLSIPGAVSIEEDVAGLKGSFDYLGVNYYTRDYLRADLADPSLSIQYVPKGRPRNDSGWDIYPEGLYMFLKRYSNLGIPLYITENGIDDRVGNVRPGFLRDHFYALQRAVQDGVDVRGYFHWSLIDNFEWQDGYGPKFGLYHVDFSSPEKTRTPTEAVGTFQDIARNLGLTPQP
jgi:beta-glucosidase